MYLLGMILLLLHWLLRDDDVIKTQSYPTVLLPPRYLQALFLQTIQDVPHLPC
jgi:hypothetical protein